MFIRLSDSEHLQRVISRNKNSLMRLYSRYVREIRRHIRSKGGNSEDAEAILKEVLAELWTESALPSFKVPENPRIFIYEKVDALWIKNHNDTAIRSFLEKRLNRKRSVPKKMLVLSSILLLLSIAAWWYFDSQPIADLTSRATSFIYKPDSLVSTSKKITGTNISRSSKNKKQGTGTVEAFSDSIEADVADTLNEKANNEANFDTSSAADQSNLSLENDDIVIKKDELLYSRIIQVTEKHSVQQEKSLSQSVAEKLNPEAQLPEEPEKTQKSFAVEFWKSPVNFKGYKIGKNKIVFFGIDEPDWVKLFSLDESVFLEYAGSYYKLESYSEFRNFIRLNDAAITSILKK